MESFSCKVNVSSDSINETAWTYAAFPEPEQHRVNGIVMACLFSVFLLVGATLNLLVIAIIFKKRLYTQPTLILLLNLAVTDFLLCVLVMPFHIIAGFAGEFVFGSSDLVRCRVCKIGVFLIMLTSQSLFSLSLISADRLLFIKKPLQYHKIVTSKRAAPTVGMIWLISISIAIPPLFNAGEIIYSRAVSHCELDIYGSIEYTISLVVIALIPLLVMTVCTLWVACIAQTHIRKVYKTKLSFTSASEKQEFTKTIYKRAKQKKSKLQFHLVRVFGAIITANIITWLPMLGWICAAAVISNKDDIPLPYRSAAFISFLFQPVLHPLLEATLVSDIKVPLIKMIRGALSCLRCKCFHRQQRNEQVFPTSPMSPTSLISSPAPTTHPAAGSGERGGLQCDCGVVVNGVRVGRVGGEWACVVCGVLDMCSVLVLPPSDDQQAEISDNVITPSDSS